jgi:GAF domain-containing protein
LQVINSSPGDLKPVFDAMLEKATRLCEAPFGVLRTWDGERFHLVAAHGDPKFIEWAWDRGSCAPADDGSPLARIIKGEGVVRFADAPNDAGYIASPGFREMVEISGMRSGVAVSLRKDDTLLGNLTVYRQEVRPFTDKQIALLQNFADQAVIAMENARLLTETREALEQQTATAEVLQVINSSPGDLAPVFEAILEKAHALCGVDAGVLGTYDGERFQAVATRGLPEQINTLVRQPFIAAPASPHDRLVRGETLVEIIDLATAEWHQDDPKRQAALEAGIRSLLYVPLRKDGNLLGYFTANRWELRPFTPREIALLENFAAQAVIAMENARLLTETREALEQQTATAEVLQVINSSPGDLARVFDAILEKAHALCGAEVGTLAAYDGEHFHALATFGYSEQFAEFVRRPSRPNVYMQRLIEGERVLHLPDQRTLESGPPDASTRAFLDLTHLRTTLFVALRKDTSLLGYISAHRHGVQPFSEKEIALLQNFAAQAVIGMENARLLGELRERTSDLQESLEYQTATSDVLKVISRSTFDLQPVLDTLCETAARLCGAEAAGLATRQGNIYRYVATFSLNPEWDKRVREIPLDPGRETIAGRVLLGRQTVHIADIAADAAYGVPETITVGKNANHARRSAPTRR